MAPGYRDSPPRPTGSATAGEKRPIVVPLSDTYQPLDTGGYARDSAASRLGRDAVVAAAPGTGFCSGNIERFDRRVEALGPDRNAGFRTATSSG